MPPKPERLFKSSVETAKEDLVNAAVVFKNCGQTPETIKEIQVQSLVHLYQRQRAAVLSVFCLMRRLMRDKKLSKTLPKAADHIAWYIEVTALLNTEELIGELNVRTEEELVAKLRKLLHAVHENCQEIGQQTDVEFKVEKSDEPVITTGADVKQPYIRRKIAE